MNIYVKTDSYCTSHYRSDEEYGDWGSNSIFSIEGVYATSPDSYSAELINVPFDFVTGDVVYVLWMTYTSGDSFGQSDGNGEVLWVFKDPQVALNAQNVWQKSHDADDHYNVTFIADGGLSVSLSNPAAGYFENVSSLDLTSFVVNP